MRSTIYGTVALVAAALLVLAPMGLVQAQVGFEYNEDTGVATGTFVSFEFDEGTGTVTNYMLSDGEPDGEAVTVFSEITIDEWSGELMGQPLDPQILTPGAVWVAIGAQATVRAIDNPVGNLAIANVGLLGAPAGFQGDIGAIGDLDLADQWLQAENAVTFTLGDGLTASLVDAENEAGGYVAIANDDFRGFLFVSNGTLAIDEVEDVVTVTVTLEGPHAVFFHGLPLFGMTAEEAAFEGEVAEAAARGDVGARVEVTPDAQAVKSSFRTSFAFEVTAAVENRVSLSISSNQPEGTIVVVDLPRDLVDPDRVIVVRLDDQEVAQAASLQLVIEAKSQGQAEPTVHLVRTADGLSLSIWVPGFSSKSLTIESVAAEPTLMGVPLLWLVAGIAALVILLGVVVALKRRK